MSSSSASLRQTHSNLAGPDDVGAVQRDRRGEDRFVTIYRPCCLRAGSKCTAALIRNISASGALIETDIDVAVGDEIEYFYAGSPTIVGRVAWRHGKKIGVGNLDTRGELPAVARFPTRPLRIEVAILAHAWLDEEWQEVGVANISQHGMMVYGIRPLRCGDLLTLRIGKQEMLNITVRWWNDGSAGLRFGKSLRIEEFARMIEQAGDWTIDPETQLRLLEVVAANDTAPGRPPA